MGRKYTRLVWTHSKTTGSDRLVLLAIADHADDEGRAWPSIGTIAEMANISHRQCQRIIRRLQLEYAELSIDEGHGRSNTHVYTVLAGKEKGDIKDDTTMSPFGDVKGDIKGDISSEKGDIADIKGDISSRKGDTAMSSESVRQSISQSIKQSKNQKGFDPLFVDLPDCVDPVLWSDWCEFRKSEIKKPLTPIAVKQQLALLTANAAQANDMLRRSMANSWRGLFPEHYRANERYSAAARPVIEPDPDPIIHLTNGKQVRRSELTGSDLLYMPNMTLKGQWN
jgi:hypothetical protein